MNKSASVALKGARSPWPGIQEGSCPPVCRALDRQNWARAAEPANGQAPAAMVWAHRRNADPRRARGQTAFGEVRVQGRSASPPLDHRNK